MRFLRPRQVLEMIGVSRTTLWRMVREGVFPPPVRITKDRRRGYLLDSVEAWMRARAEGRPFDMEDWTASPGHLSREPIIAPAGERQALERIGRAIAPPNRGVARLRGPRGEEMIIPQSLYAVLVQAVEELTSGRGPVHHAGHGRADD